MRIDMDTCEEILVTITRNKTRSLLTAFGVFWGIFMLVALIGGGQGMQEQMKAQFEGFATNSGFIACPDRIPLASCLPLQRKRQARPTKDFVKDAGGTWKWKMWNGYAASTE